MAMSFPGGGREQGSRSADLTFMQLLSSVLGFRGGSIPLGVGERPPRSAECSSCLLFGVRFWCFFCCLSSFIRAIYVRVNYRPFIYPIDCRLCPVVAKGLYGCFQGEDVLGCGASFLCEVQAVSSLQGVLAFCRLYLRSDRGFCAFQLA